MLRIIHHILCSYREKIINELSIVEIMASKIDVVREMLKECIFVIIRICNN